MAVGTDARSRYQDFMNYYSGVYIPDTTSGLLGGHCVKIVGWGEDAGEKARSIFELKRAFRGGSCAVCVEALHPRCAVLERCKLLGPGVG